MFANVYNRYEIKVESAVSRKAIFESRNTASYHIFRSKLALVWFSPIDHSNVPFTITTTNNNDVLRDASSSVMIV